MNNRFIIQVASIALCFTICTGTTIYAQDYVAPPVIVSKEKVKYGGRLYYSHIVQERQTVFSISKAYGVSIDDIYNANPALKETGLKKNAIILIPVIPEDSKQPQDTEQNRAAAPGPEQAGNAVTEDVQKADRPESRSRNEKRAARQKKQDEDYIIHTVRWYEDLDVISDKYGVPVNDIMEINGLKGRKLSNRQKLKIPRNAAAREETVPADENSALPKEETSAGTGGIRTEALFSYRPRKTVKAVLMLPLNAAEGGSENPLDFYSGVLLAAKELGETGISIDLSVYDVAGGILPVTVERMQESDIIIGPVSTGDLTRLLEKDPGNRTYIVSPLDHRTETLAYSNPYFIQVPTPYRVQYRNLTEWIRQDRKASDRVIVINEKGARATEETAELNQALAQSGIQYSSFSYNILEGRNVSGTLESLMSKENVNRVMVISESEAFVNDVMRNLNLMIHEKYNIILYAPSKIRSFETIDVENFHNTQLHTSLAYYVDYSDRKVMDFIMKYRALYNTEPTPFAFQGYDIAYYFLKLCSNYGEKWGDMLPNENMQMLQTGFEFERIPDGGYINSAVKRIVYGPDYSIGIF